MHNLFISPMLKIVSKIWPQLLRSHFTSQKLDSFLKIDVSSSGDRIQYNFHSQEGFCYLTVTNLSPFDFAVDRMEISVSTDACSFSCLSLMPVDLKGMGAETIYARSKSPMVAETAQRAKTSQRARIEVRAYVTSKIRNFTISRHIDDVKNVTVHV